jgi:hypothetical protein
MVIALAAMAQGFADVGEALNNGIILKQQKKCCTFAPFLTQNNSQYVS